MRRGEEGNGISRGHTHVGMRKDGKGGGQDGGNSDAREHVSVNRTIHYAKGAGAAGGLWPRRSGWLLEMDPRNYGGWRPAY